MSSRALTPPPAPRINHILCLRGNNTTAAIKNNESDHDDSPPNNSNNNNNWLLLECLMDGSLRLRDGSRGSSFGSFCSKRWQLHPTIEDIMAAAPCPSAAVRRTCASAAVSPSDPRFFFVRTVFGDSNAPASMGTVAKYSLGSVGGAAPTLHAVAMTEGHHIDSVAPEAPMAVSARFVVVHTVREEFVAEEGGKTARREFAGLSVLDATTLLLHKVVPLSCHGKPSSLLAVRVCKIVAFPDNSDRVVVLMQNNDAMVIDVNGGALRQIASPAVCGGRRFRDVDVSPCARIIALAGDSCVVWLIDVSSLVLLDPDAAVKTAPVIVPFATASVDKLGDSSADEKNELFTSVKFLSSTHLICQSVRQCECFIFSIPLCRHVLRMPMPVDRSIGRRNRLCVIPGSDESTTCFSVYQVGSEQGGFVLPLDHTYMTTRLRGHATGMGMGASPSLRFAKGAPIGITTLPVELVIGSVSTAATPQQQQQQQEEEPPSAIIVHATMQQKTCR